MTREKLMKEIAKRIKDIRELYYSEYPYGDYLEISFRKNNISFNNESWKDGKDENFPINYHENKEYIRINDKYEAKKC